jgi:hypothetical protein
MITKEDIEEAVWFSLERSFENSIWNSVRNSINDSVYDYSVWNSVRISFFSVGISALQEAEKNYI